MNIIDAIKSGKAFKRAIWTRDYVRPPFMNLNLSAEELVANDWEVEEKPIPLTASLFDSKAKRVLDRCQYNTIDDTLGVVELALADLKRELGL